MAEGRRPTRAVGGDVGTGWPSGDPTENVLALVAAQVKRADDLMTAFERLMAEKHLRQDDLRNLEAKHIREVADLRENFTDKLRSAETERINAIRAVDVGAVGRAAEVSAAQAITLATQVSTSAETLRTQVQAAASAAAAALIQALEPIQTSIGELRKTQYEQQGQQAQRQESRVDQRAGTQNNQWIIGVIIGVAIFAADFVAKKI